MSQLDLLTPDIQAERISRDVGMATAAAHADRVSPNWTVNALAFMVGYIATTSGPFMTEDVRLAAERANFPAPPDSRAWGSVTVAAKARNLIKRIGYGPQRAAGCHMAPKSIWKRA